MNHCAVCGIACPLFLCPGCGICWSLAAAPPSQEGFEAWAQEERERLRLAREEGIYL